MEISLALKGEGRVRVKADGLATTNVETKNVSVSKPS
jgi:hypothetical protein